MCWSFVSLGKVMNILLLIKDLICLTIRSLFSFFSVFFWLTTAKQSNGNLRNSSLKLFWRWWWWWFHVMFNSTLWDRPFFLLVLISPPRYILNCLQWKSAKSEIVAELHTLLVTWLCSAQSMFLFQHCRCIRWDWIKLTSTPPRFSKEEQYWSQTDQITRVLRGWH